MPVYGYGSTGSVREDDIVAKVGRVTIRDFKMQIDDDHPGPFQREDGRICVLAYFFEDVAKAPDGIDAATGINVRTYPSGMRFAEVPINLLTDAKITVDGEAQRRTQRVIDNFVVKAGVLDASL